ncbi:MAG: hypothetical protein LBT10_04375 [Methanobrevibacter sp.]|jgi:hypothetical protein|nr:hypothetical protein [Methanobrevibacter sp.]
MDYERVLKTLFSTRNLKSGILVFRQKKLALQKEDGNSKSGIWICSRKSLDHIHVIKLLSFIFNFSIVKIHANFTVPKNLDHIPTIKFLVYFLNFKKFSIF